MCDICNRSLYTCLLWVCRINKNIFLLYSVYLNLTLIPYLSLSLSLSSVLPYSRETLTTSNLLEFDFKCSVYDYSVVVWEEVENVKKTCLEKQCKHSQTNTHFWIGWNIFIFFFSVLPCIFLFVQSQLILIISDVNVNVLSNQEKFVRKSIDTSSPNIVHKKKNESKFANSIATFDFNEKISGFHSYLNKRRNRKS